MNQSLSIRLLLLWFCGVSGALAGPPNGIQGLVTVENDATNPVPVTLTDQAQVTIENDAANPVPVTVTDSAPTSQRVRILLGGSVNCSSVPCNDSFATSSYAVPEGKTLLIDEVAVRESFTGLGGAVLLSTTGVGEQIQVPPLGPLIVAGGSSIASRSVRMHTTGIVQVIVRLDQVPGGLVAMKAVIFGRLVDGADQLIDCDPDTCF